MTNYISSINGLSLLQNIKEDDNLFLVIHEDDLKNISLDIFEKNPRFEECFLSI